MWDSSLLQSEAISQILVGFDRTHLNTRAMSASSDLKQSIDYAFMNMSPENIAIILSYKNKPGRNMYVLESEWTTFSHIPKIDQLQAYVMIPVGEGVRSEGLATPFFLYKDFETYEFTFRAGSAPRSMRIAQCEKVKIHIDKKFVCSKSLTWASIKSASMGERSKQFFSVLRAMSDN
jgi:hypothetical protein